MLHPSITKVEALHTQYLTVSFCSLLFMDNLDTRFIRLRDYQVVVLKTPVFCFCFFLGSEVALLSSGSSQVARAGRRIYWPKPYRVRPWRLSA